MFISSLNTLLRWSENSVRFENFYGNWLPEGPNSVRFYLTVCDMACMSCAFGTYHIYVIACTGNVNIV